MRGPTVPFDDFESGIKATNRVATEVVKDTSNMSKIEGLQAIKGIDDGLTTVNVPSLLDGNPVHELEALFLLSAAAMKTVGASEAGAIGVLLVGGGAAWYQVLTYQIPDGPPYRPQPRVEMAPIPYFDNN